MEYCQSEWPSYPPHSLLLCQYWDHRGHLTVVDGLLIYDDRIVIPRSLRLEILDRIHEGHLGITKCRARARNSVWWPGLSCSIADMVSRCFTCNREKPTPRETLLPSSFPTRPWERLGVDLMELKGAIYLVVVDYYSRWLEIKKLSGQTSESVIAHLKSIFACHGIPVVLMSDNGPQFSSGVFRAFTAEYGILHVTSSPYCPQANGEAERAVKTAKQLLSKNNDPYLGLLTYRSTPLQNGLSPSELLMGRRLRTRLPVLPSTLMPGIGIKDLEQVMAKEERLRGKQERNFNESHRARDLPPLEPGDSVWVRDKDREGQVLCRTPNPRSYLIERSQGTLRRNRASLVPTNMKPPSRVADFPALTSPRSPVAEQPTADMGSAPSSSPPHALSTFFLL